MFEFESSQPLISIADTDNAVQFLEDELVNLQLDNTVHVAVLVDKSDNEDSSFRHGPIRLYVPEEGPTTDFSLRPVNIGEFNSRYQALHEQITTSPGNYLEKKQLLKRTETNSSVSSTPKTID
jgi:hypothetical protein